MKRILVVFAILTFVLAGQLAHAAYLDSSWYANVTNVRTFGGNYSLDPFWGSSGASTHIAVDGFTGAATFRVGQSGNAPTGETAYWGNTTLADSNTMGSISFDYETHWSEPNLSLVLEAVYMHMPYSEVIWSSAGGNDHVTITGNPNGYRFSLTVLPVPEPSGMAVSCLCLSGFITMLRRRIRNRGEQ